MHHSTDSNNIEAGWVKTEKKETQNDILSFSASREAK